MNLFESLYKTKTDIKHKELDDGLKSDLIDYIDEIIDNMADYYDVVYYMQRGIKIGGFNSTEAYQREFQRTDEKRRNIHNSIMYGLLSIDKLADVHGFAKCYGEFTDEEIQDNNLVINNRPKREEIANSVFESIGCLVRGFEIDDKTYGTKKTVRGIEQVMEEQEVYIS